MYHIEKDTGDLVIDGFETGIAPSPHKGIANIQNGNISTETGELLSSFVRAQQSMTSTATGTGTLTYADGSHVNLSIAGSNNLFKGQWITVTNSSNTGQLPNGTYYVPPSTGSTYQLQKYYNSSTYYTPISSVQTLVIGAGAGGSGSSATVNAPGGSGGGGGQVISSTYSNINLNGSYNITIGTGGAGGNTSGSNGSAGTSSQITSNNLTGNSIATTTAQGGGGTTSNSGIYAGGASGNGNAGGAGNASTPTSGGGGGGAGGVGGAASLGTGGNGGLGVYNSISGASIGYSGGGAGSGGNTSNGTATEGGGSAGSLSGGAGGNGTSPGAGGGGGHGNAGNGFAGGNGANGILFTAFWVGLGGSLPSISTPTYNGQNMTQLYLDNTTFSDQVQAVYYLINPPTGSNTVAINHTGGGNCYTYAISSSYTGVKQSSSIDASPAANSFSGATSASGAVTVVDQNAWVVGFQLDHAGAGLTSAGANTTKRGTAGASDGWASSYDHNGAGSTTLNSSWTGAATGKFYAFSIASLATASTNPAFLLNFV